MYIDAHCHLERATYGDELDAVIQRAFAADLIGLVAVGASHRIAGAEEALALARRHTRIAATCGIHPHEAEQATERDFDELARIADEPEMVAIGEVGLDYYYDHSPRATQRQVFERLARLARQRNLPLMLHVRDAHEDAWSVLDDVGLPERGGVVHCFTAGVRESVEYLRRGLYLSIPGVVTFTKSNDLREAVALAPAERLLVETDSPYLAPVPHRGRRNEPAYVVATTAALAAVRGLTPAQAASLTVHNARRLFGFDGWTPATHVS